MADNKKRKKDLKSDKAKKPKSESSTNEVLTSGGGGSPSNDGGGAQPVFDPFREYDGNYYTTQCYAVIPPSDPNIGVKVKITVEGESFQWNLAHIPDSEHQQQSSLYAFKGEYYGSGSRLGNPFLCTGGVCFSVDIEVNCDGVITNVNIPQINVRQQMFPPPVVYNGGIPPRPTCMYPSVVYENDEFVLTLNTRDLHRWPGHPYEISGCSVQLKKPLKSAMKKD